ncbi:MAG TPA: ABC transporter ATP-binding protein [Acidimicrobiia bacterium]|nr:ABC transporter ATP-binding protein [Acidimicrobiia bacterium]
MTITGVRATSVTKRVDQPPRTLTFPDVELTRGELVAVTGPTASGKTILVNFLAGWDRPDSGTVEWVGASASPPPWSAVAVVPQQFALVDELDVIENITLATRAGVELADDAIAELMEALRLDRLVHRNVQEISVGERQRVMVARALAGTPDVILADEPVAHQDRQNAETVVRLLRERAARGTACLVATREADIAAGADRRIELAPASHAGDGPWSDETVTTWISR